MNHVLIYAVSIHRERLANEVNDDNAGLEACIKIYRKVYLLSCLYNIVFGSYIIPLWKYIAVVATSISLYFIISRRVDSISTAFIITFMLIAAISVILPATILMASIYNTSIEIKSRLRQNIDTLSCNGKRKYLNGMVNSLPLIRCQVGIFYHMDDTIKLTLIDIFINLLVFLLLN